MKKKQIKQLIKDDWPRKDYKVKILKILNRQDWGMVLVMYKVECFRDGTVEHRCKNLVGKSRWDYATKIDF